MGAQAHTRRNGWRSELQRTSEWENELMKEWASKQTNEWMSEQRKAGMNEQMSNRAKKQMRTCACAPSTHNLYKYVCSHLNRTSTRVCKWSHTPMRTLLVHNKWVRTAHTCRWAGKKQMWKFLNAKIQTVFITKMLPCIPSIPWLSTSSPLGMGHRPLQYARRSFFLLPRRSALEATKWTCKTESKWYHPWEGEC